MIKKAEKILKIESAKNEPFVVMSTDYYKSLMATVEELSDPESLMAVKESSKDVYENKIYSQKQVLKLFDASNKLHTKSRKRSKKD